MGEKSLSGLASATNATRKRVAQAGGRAPHPNGWGTKDPVKRREIARLGGLARHKKAQERKAKSK